MSHQHPSNITCHIISYNNKILKWFISLIWYLFKVPFSLLCSTRWDEQNYIPLVYVLKNKLTHHCLKFSPSIWSSWIDRVDFSLFFGPVRFASAQLTNVVTAPHHIMLHSHWIKMSSLPPLWAMLHHVAFPFEPKPNHWIRTTTTDHPPELPDSHTPLLISTVVTLPTTQQRLYFASFLARAPCHQSFTPSSLHIMTHTLTN
jgi:hypothetical protein